MKEIEKVVTELVEILPRQKTLVIDIGGENDEIDTEQFYIDHLTTALTTIYNKGKEEERERVIDMVKTTKEAYMFPSTEERFINDLNQ